MVANMSDEDIWRLNRGGLDALKVYAAYDRAVKHEGRPVVILAKTVKGFGMGEAGEGKMTAHQAKKLGVEDLKAFRDRFDIPISDEDIDERCLITGRPRTAKKSRYLQARRRELGGYLPVRNDNGSSRSRCRRWMPFSRTSTVRASAKFLRRWRGCAC